MIRNSRLSAILILAELIALLILAQLIALFDTGRNNGIEAAIGVHCSLRHDELIGTYAPLVLKISQIMSQANQAICHFGKNLSQFHFTEILRAYLMSVWKFDQIQCIAASKQVPSIELIFSIVNFLRVLGIGSGSLAIKRHHISSFNKLSSQAQVPFRQELRNIIFLALTGSMVSQVPVQRLTNNLSGALKVRKIKIIMSASSWSSFAKSQHVIVKELVR